MRKNILTKPLSLLLLISALFTALASCNEKTDPQNESTSGQDGETTPQIVEETIPFLVNGVTDIKVMRPDSSQKDFVYNFFSDVRDIIEDITGQLPAISYEASEGAEILIGSCGTDILDELSSKYRAKDYFMGVYKGKIVIYGSTETTLRKAVEQFEELLSEKYAADSSNITLSSLENIEFVSQNYAVNSFTIANTPIQKYDIVYSADEPYSRELFALKLKARLETATGFPFNVYTDNKISSDAPKIIIGKTDFSENASVEKFDFKIEVSSGNIFFLADSIEGYDSMLKYFYSTYLTDKNVTLDEGFTATKSIDMSTVDVKINKTGDVRVIFNNILGNCDNNQYPVSYRTRSVTELLSSFNADVIGLQECSPTSRSFNIVKLMKNYGFEEVAVTPTNSKKSNYTPLFYNPETVKVIAADYVYYAGTLNDGGSKSITWAVFETLSDKKQFAVCSTHFFYQGADMGGDAGRLENAKTLVETAKSIADKYKVPVIAGGDLNTKTTTSVFSHLTSNGFTSIQGIAKTTDKTNTHHAYPEFSSDLGYYSNFAYPTENSYASKAIDHALVYNKGSLVFNLFDVISEDFALMSSDHCPLVVDFTFAE